MNETMNRPEIDLTREQVDAAFIGIVANMNTVELNVNSVMPVVEANKGAKFGAALPESSVNTGIAIDGGMSIADQEALKGDVANKFDPEHIAQVRARQMDDFFENVVLVNEADAHAKKKKSPFNYAA